MNSVFGLISLLTFLLTVGISLIGSDTEKYTGVIAIAQYLILLTVIIYPAFTVWCNEYLKSEHVLKATLVNSRPTFELLNKSSLHPDSKGLVRLEINLSCESDSDISLKSIELHDVSDLELMFKLKATTRLLDQQDNHKPFQLPRLVKSKSTNQIFVEFSFEPNDLEKNKVVGSEEPSHIMEFVPILNQLKDIESKVSIVYMHQGSEYVEQISVSLPITHLKDHYRGLWRTQRWIHAVEALHA
ncbi:MAG: hypothetical protein GY928_04980 [Colwellia sp.]|nr:hypothetical protein [Colwellia sp.]